MPVHIYAHPFPNWFFQLGVCWEGVCWHPRSNGKEWGQGLVGLDSFFQNITVISLGSDKFL